MGPLTLGSVKAFHILLDQPPLDCCTNLFMAKEIDPKTIELANSIESESNQIAMLKGFLDDIFMAYTGSVKFLHTLLDQLNTVPLQLSSQCHTSPAQMLYKSFHGLRN